MYYLYIENNLIKAIHYSFFVFFFQIKVCGKKLNKSRKISITTSMLISVWRHNKKLNLIIFGIVAFVFRLRVETFSFFSRQRIHFLLLRSIVNAVVIKIFDLIIYYYYHLVFTENIYSPRIFSRGRLTGNNYKTVQYGGGDSLASCCKNVVFTIFFFFGCDNNFWSFVVLKALINLVTGN